MLLKSENKAIGSACFMKEPDVTSVIAETNVGNPSSQRVLEKCGMRKYKQMGESIRWRLSEPLK